MGGGGLRKRASEKPFALGCRTCLFAAVQWEEGLSGRASKKPFAFGCRPCLFAVAQWEERVKEEGVREAVCIWV